MKPAGKSVPGGTVGLGSESQKQSPHDRRRRIGVRILQRGRLRYHSDRDPQPERTRILEIRYRPLYGRREIMRAGLLTPSVRRRKGGRSGGDDLPVSEAEGGASR